MTRRKDAELRLERQLRIEAGLARCSKELLAPTALPDDLRAVATPAVEHLRAALDVDQAYLMQLVADAEDPYLTVAAFTSVPIEIVADHHPLARCFPLSLLPPSQRRALDAGEPVIGLPERSELVTPAQHAWLDQDHAQTRITLPVLVAGQLWGVIGFNGLTAREWGPQEQTVLRTAGEMFSHVIQRWVAARELRRSEEQFRTAVETMLDGFAILDNVRDEGGAVRDFRFRYINEVGSRLNQRPREEHLGRTLLELLPAHAGSALFDDYVRLVETGTPVSRESMLYEEVLGSGERLARVVDVRAARLGDGMAVVWRDVTDRHLAHTSLAQANDDLLRRVNELRTLNLIAQTLASTQDLQRGLRTVCSAVATRTGAAQVAVACFDQPGSGPDHQAKPAGDALAEILTLAPDELGPLGPTLLTARHSLTLSRDEQPAALSEQALRRLGCAESTHLLLAPLTSAAGSLGLLALGSGPGARPFSPDDQRLVETMASQIATAISNARLAEQAQQAARLAERNRVARDLHDSATQALYSLSLLAGGWAMQAEQGRVTDVPAKFTQLGGIALQVLKELRLLIYELRHPDLAEVGLAKALEQRLAAVEQRANVGTSLTVTGELAPLPQHVEEQLYAMLQEALNNALRHGQARSVAVSISVEDGQTVFAVRDDGGGFEPEAPSSGMGLRGMRERAAALGARLTLTSAPGAGTQVTIIVPRPETRGSTHG